MEDPVSPADRSPVFLTQVLGDGNWKTLACVFGLLLTTALTMTWEGRRFWCACGNWRLLSNDAWGKHNSQHLFDPYSLTHVEHGVLFFGFLLLVCPRWSESRRFCLATAVECLWEVFENSAFVINRYRTTTAALGYTGDTIANSFGDIASCMFGYFLARWLGLWRSVVFLLAAEVLLLFWIRDNLTLNILMLLWPIEAISTWQTAT